MTVRHDVDFEDFLNEFEGDPAFESARTSLRAQTNLAINVNRIRNAIGLSQEELASKAGMRQPSISKIERGESNPRLDTIVRIATALGVGVEALFTHPDTEPVGEPAGAQNVIVKHTWVVFEEGPSGPRVAAWDDAANDLFALHA
jgi:transcriptional regulator with XRE-family HTH domain